MKIQINEQLVSKYFATNKGVRKPSKDVVRNKNLIKNWKTVTLATVEEILSLFDRLVIDGITVRLGIKTKSNKLDDFESCQGFFIDLDATSQAQVDTVLNSEFVKDYCFFAYPTSSYNPVESKYNSRLIFLLDEPITDYNKAKHYLNIIWSSIFNTPELTKATQGIDTACSDPTRLYYGAQRPDDQVSEHIWIRNSNAQFISLADLDSAADLYGIVYEEQSSKVSTSLEFIDNFARRKQEKDLSGLDSLSDRFFFYLWSEVITAKFDGDWVKFTLDLVNKHGYLPPSKSDQPFTLSSTNAVHTEGLSYRCSDPILPNENYPESDSFSLTLNYNSHIVWRSNKHGSAGGNLLDLIIFCERRSYGSGKIGSSTASYYQTASEILSKFSRKLSMKSLDETYGYSLDKAKKNKTGNSDITIDVMPVAISEVTSEVMPDDSLEVMPEFDSFDDFDEIPHANAEVMPDDQVSTPDWVVVHKNSRSVSYSLRLDLLVPEYLNTLDLYIKDTGKCFIFMYYNNVTNLWSLQYSTLFLCRNFRQWLSDKLITFLKLSNKNSVDLNWLRSVEIKTIPQSSTLQRELDVFISSNECPKVKMLPHQKIGAIGFRNGDFYDGTFYPEFCKDFFIQTRYEFDYDYSPEESEKAIQFLRDFIYEIFDPYYTDAILGFISLCCQNRAFQAQTMLYFTGTAGTGKSLLATYLSSLLGTEKFYNVSNADQFFESRFSSKLYETASIIFFDEFHLGANYYGTLKELVTKSGNKSGILPTMFIESKGVDTYQAYTNFAFIGAHQDLPTSLRDLGLGRRLMIIPVRETRVTNQPILSASNLIEPISDDFEDLGKEVYDQRSRDILFHLINIPSRKAIEYLVVAKRSQAQKDLVNHINDTNDKYWRLFNENLEFTGDMSDFIVSNWFVESVTTKDNDFRFFTVSSFMKELNAYCIKKEFVIKSCAKDSRIRLKPLGAKKEDPARKFTGYRGVRLQEESILIEAYIQASGGFGQRAVQKSPPTAEELAGD